MTLRPELEDILRLIQSRDFPWAEERLRALSRPSSVPIAAAWLQSPDPQVRYAWMLLLSHTRRYQEAFDTGESLVPLLGHEPRFRFHHGRNCLAQGDFARGMALFVSARENQFIGEAPPPTQRPLWKGEPLLGRKVLLITEGGLGDALCFSRFASLFQLFGAQSVLATYQMLFPVLRQMGGVTTLVDLSHLRGSPQPLEAILDFDFWLPLMCAPTALGFQRGDVSSTPYLQVPPSVRRGWEKQFREIQPRRRLRVGLCYQGNPSFQEDAVRSIRGDLLNPFVDSVDADFFAFSHHQGANPWRHPHVRDISGLCQTPLDLMGVIDQLDVLVTCDSAPVHMAGAMGKPCILLNRVMGWVTFALAPDHENLQPSDWYKSVSILHQKQWGEWGETIQRLIQVFPKFVAEHVGPIEEAPNQVSLDGVAHPLAAPALSAHAVVEVPTALGPVLTLPNDFFVGRALEVYGEYSPHEVAVLRRALKPGDWVLDGGCQLGWLTLIMAELVGPSGSVLAVDPQQKMIELLRDNMRRQGKENVSTICAALGSADGEVCLELPDYGRTGNFGAVETWGLHTVRADMVRVPCRRVDDLPMRRVDLIKLDIEGRELSALQGARETLSRFRPKLILEDDREEQRSDLYRFLKEVGYNWIVEEKPLFSRRNFNNQPVNIYGSTVYRNLLAWPQEIKNPFQD